MAEHGLKHPERYDYQAVKDMLNACTSLKMEALLAILYGCGVRVSEARQIRGQDIQIVEIEGQKVLRIYSTTLKNKADKQRFIYIAFDKEPWLVYPILKYSQISPEAKLFPHDRKTLFRWVKKETGINPHGFRAIRGCHLVSQFDFTDQKLTAYMGWTDSRPAKFYIKLRGKDIVPGF